MYQKVLVPVSGGERGHRSQKAIEKAMEICKGEIVVLHVVEPIAQTVGGEDRVELEKEENSKGLMLLCPIIEKLQIARAPFHTRIVPGTPAETIVGIADEENVDLIIMATDGAEGLAGMFLGSTTERVLRNTDRDLLAIRV